MTTAIAASERIMVDLKCMIPGKVSEKLVRNEN